jgi:hypothetical protein
MLSPELQTMYATWLGETSYSYLGYVQPTLSGTFGLGLQYLSSSPMPKLTEGVRDGEFTFYDGAANLLYAVRLGETTSVGLNLRGLQSVIGTSSLSSFTGDAGFMFRTLEEGFSFGVSGQNLFGQMGEDKLPLTTRAGLAFKSSLPEHYSDVLFTLEAGKTGDEPLYYAAGIEHWGGGTLGSPGLPVRCRRETAEQP